MADEEKRNPTDDVSDDGTLIDSDLLEDAVRDPSDPDPLVTLDHQDEIRADDGEPGESVPGDSAQAVDEDSTVMVDIEPQDDPDDEPTVMVEIPEGEEGEEEEEEDENAKTVLIESPFQDEEPESQAPSAQLVISFGNDSGKEFPLSTEILVVGRSLDADIILNDPSVSRKHFEIHFREDGWLLKDLGSVNGTKVDGQRVDGEAPLQEGVQIEAGQTIMLFSSDDEKTRVLEIPEESEHEEVTMISEPPDAEQVRMQSSPRIEVSDTPDDGQGKRFPVVALILAILTVVIGGWAIAQFGLGMRILPIGPDPEIEAARKAEIEAARIKVKARDLNALGLVAFQAREWDRAIKMFSSSLDLDPSIEGLQANLDRSREEEKNATFLAAGKAALEKGEMDKVAEMLSKVQNSSVHYPEARQLLDSAGDQLVDKEIEKIRSDMAQSRMDDARNHYLTLLEKHPDNDKVITLRDELVEAGLRLDPIRRKPAAAPQQPKTVAATGWHSQPKPRKRQGTRTSVDIGGALRLYEQGSFQQAIDGLRSASGRLRKVDAERARALAEKIDQFATAYRGGKVALKSKRLDKAEQGLGLALRVDHGINGHYEPEIRSYLGDTYRGRAAAAIQNTDYVLAAKSARKALSYKTGDHLARTIMDKCISVASRYYEQAANDIKDGKRDEARQKLKMVLDIVPSTHQLADKASELMHETR